MKKTTKLVAYNQDWTNDITSIGDTVYKEACQRCKLYTVLFNVITKLISALT